MAGGTARHHARRFGFQRLRLSSGSRTGGAGRSTSRPRARAIVGGHGGLIARAAGPVHSGADAVRSHGAGASGPRRVGASTVGSCGAASAVAHRAVSHRAVAHRAAAHAALAAAARSGHPGVAHPGSGRGGSTGPRTYSGSSCAGATRSRTHPTSAGSGPAGAATAGCHGADHWGGNQCHCERQCMCPANHATTLLPRA